MVSLPQQSTKAHELMKLHLDVLKLLFNGEKFPDIKNKFVLEMEELDYINTLSPGLLSFDSRGNLIGAYPISPIESPYRVSVEGIGDGYSMCAIDALGVAYTFNAKTTIFTRDYSTNELIQITIDPSLETQESQDFIVTYQETSSKDLVAAVSVCPSIHFHSNAGSIVDQQNIKIMDFETALKSAVSQFTVSALTSCIDRAILKKSGLPMVSDDTCC